MAALWLVLVLAVTLHHQVDATQVTFSKKDGMIYVETDPKHYALYGQVVDKNGVRIIAIDEEGQHHLTSKCDTDWVAYKKIGSENLKKFSQLREYHLGLKGDPKESPENGYIWSDTFTKEDKVEELPVVRQLDKDTLVYASKYFPSYLARVIVSGKVVIYVNYNGAVTIKTMNCLYLNEKIFMEGIKRINPDKRMIPLLSSKCDKVLKKHLKSNNFDEVDFGSELKYFKTYTKAEWNAMQRAIMGQGVRAFDGWGP